MPVRRGCVFWVLGPTSAGKTTLASSFARRARAKGIAMLHYDGDDIRNLFGPSLKFSDDDRLRVVKALVFLANHAAESGFDVVVSALTAGQSAREYVLSNISGLRVIYITCSTAQCIKRDPKGLYAKALRGEIDSLIGYNTPYIPPEKYDLLLDTESASVERLVEEMEKFAYTRDPSR